MSMKHNYTITTPNAQLVIEADSRGEAVKKYLEQSGMTEEFFRKHCMCKICTYSADVISPSRFLEMMKEIEELQAAVPKWISVEERLPDVHNHVLVNIPGESPFPTVKEAFLEKNGLWYSNGFRYNPEEVTHWMPLPEPPKEE